MGFPFIPMHSLPICRRLIMIMSIAPRNSISSRTNKHSAMFNTRLIDLILSISCHLFVIHYRLRNSHRLMLSQRVGDSHLPLSLFFLPHVTLKYQLESAQIFIERNFSVFHPFRKIWQTRKA